MAEMGMDIFSFLIFFDINDFLKEKALNHEDKKLGIFFKEHNFNEIRNILFNNERVNRLRRQLILRNSKYRFPRNSNKC